MSQTANSSITLFESSLSTTDGYTTDCTCDTTACDGYPTDSTCDSTTDSYTSDSYTTKSYTPNSTTNSSCIDTCSSCIDTCSSCIDTCTTHSTQSTDIHSTLLSIETLSIATVTVAATNDTNINAINDTNANISLPILPPRRKSLHPILPLELWNAILKKTDLKKSRLLNKKFNLFSNDILIDIYTPFVDSLSASFDRSLATYRQLKLIKTPQMDHFKQFLLSPTTMENLNEIIWYTNAQIEVQSVCECLVRLFGAFPDLESSSRISWNDIRKILRRSDFKLWLQHLAVHVEFIDIKDTKKVEQIIRVDPLITYERLREVSMAAYRLLILVAASLQFSTISDELEHANRECKEIERKLKSASDFLECLSS